MAQITRIEPSLQAAFVEYGGNRHGFLAFNEIHPDYYRIPVEDKEKLLADEEAAAKSASDDENGEDNEDDIRPQRRRPSGHSRRYKIQEVISKHQLLLVQVVKEERGGKGAALTTYISLAGRYCVLMPNTYNNSGGVSRKISDIGDRKKLKSIIASLKVPKGMAVIARTAGSKRTKAEITRDFNYLTRQWNEIRELTVNSEAPALIHEEGNLINRTIRDHYTNDIAEIIVEGEETYKHAKQYMKNLMPTHVKRIELYDGKIPLLQQYQVEEMLASMHQPQVTLKSGGYIIINQTEALVAIDVNSGRATRERNIEETALKTNVEAAEEIARQLRLRDLSGLIVLDFIDMERNSNKNTVERKLKEALKPDKARIQIGSISQFGLLEMSRQRLRPSLTETFTTPCPHCQGSGRIHSLSTAAMLTLRAIEVAAHKTTNGEVKVHMHSSLASHILNEKRESIATVESQFGVRVMILTDDSMIIPQLRFEGIPDMPQQQSNDKESRGRRKRRSKNKQSESESSSEETRPRNNRRRGRRGKRHSKTETTEAIAAPIAPPQEEEVKPQPKAKKTTAKKVQAKKAVKKVQAKAKKPAPKAKAKTKASPQPAAKKSAKSASASSSSAAVEVVDIDSIAPSKRKKGWWSG